MVNNPYLNEVKLNLPRLLALFDNDRTSDSYGMGDRFYWAWGLNDFNNAAFQGAANGLTRLWVNGLWPYPTDEAKFIERIDALFLAAKNSTNRDGSLNQAFPRESSYALTGFVAFDLLIAIDNLNGFLDTKIKSRWLKIIEPMIGYLIKADETHGVVSNHLAGAVAALVRWDLLSQDSSAMAKARTLLDRVLTNQSKEGWFLEYEGADPGYQTLCTHYLADIHINRPDWELIRPLRMSLKFLWQFAHPDGSFGGIYGSRNTRFYYPSGIIALSSEIPEAAALSSFMVTSIAEQKVVTLSAVDESNLIPFFNAYCWALVLQGQSSNSNSIPKVPCQEWSTHRTNFPEAGLIIDAGPNHYTVISTYKGGVVSHYTKQGECYIDVGLVVKDKFGKFASTQSYSPSNVVKLKGQSLTIESSIVAMPKQLPTPFQFLILRALGLTLFRSYHIREFIKRALVRLLITNKKVWPMKNNRSIKLGAELHIKDDVKLPTGYSIFENPGSFVSIHMASQGYWQIQDECTLYLKKY